jgi:hypothetical protein
VLLLLGVASTSLDFPTVFVGKGCLSAFFNRLANILFGMNCTLFFPAACEEVGPKTGAAPAETEEETEEATEEETEEALSSKGGGEQSASMLSLI